MEKYRRFADAATGINPFVAKVGIGSGAGVVAASSGIGTFQSSNVAPNALVTGLAYVFFPVRLIVLGLIAALLFVFEGVGELIRSIGLQSIVGDFIFQPVVILLSRALLTVAAGISPVRRLYPLRGSPSVTANNGALVLDEAVLTAKAGDVVISNLITPFDVMAIQAATPLRPALLTATKDALKKAGVAENAWRCPTAMVAFVSHKEPRVVSFAPGALQRWQVFNYILSTTTKAYLAEGPVGPSQIVDLTLLQKKAQSMGVPLLVFPEGTTSSGQTMLTCSGIVTNTANNNAAAAAPSFEDSGRQSNSSSALRTHIISVSYESAVPAKVIESSDAAMLGTAAFFGAGSSAPLRYLFNLSRRGSGTVVTSSAANAAASMDALAAGVFSFLGFGPLFGYQNRVRVTFVRPSQVPTTTMPITAAMVSSPSSPLSPMSPGATVAATWINEVRAKVCASVTFGNPNVLCKPVAVGVVEKRAYSAYVEQETAAAAVAKGEQQPAADKPVVDRPPRPSAAAGGRGGGAKRE